MRTIKITGLALAAVAAASGGAQAAGKCVVAGGEATMVTQDLAKFMAEAALKNSIAAHNWKAAGPVTVKCDAPYGMAHCMARRKACG